MTIGMTVAEMQDMMMDEMDHSNKELITIAEMNQVEIRHILTDS